MLLKKKTQQKTIFLTVKPNIFGTSKTFTTYGSKSTAQF